MSTNYPEHDRPFFYKYYSAETAKIVLSNQTLQYSPPTAFNDPFDIQTELFFDFDIDDFAKRFFPKFLDVIKGVSYSSVKFPFYVPQMPSIDWESLPKDYSRDVIRILHDLIMKTQDYHNEHWKSLLPKLRVFCVSEVNDNILMWSHYANNHKGVCVRLKVMPEIDNPMCAAKKVVYTKSPPSIPTVLENLSLDDWVDIFLGKEKNTDTSGYRRFALFKSSHWAYEKEWRVWFPSEVENSADPFYMKLKENELDTIFFGYKCRKHDIEEIYELANRYNSSINFYQGIKNKKSYNINFVKVQF